MFRPVSLYIGLRYTRAKRRNHFISFISMTSMLGIALGVMVLITVLSVMNGFDEAIRDHFFAMAQQVTVKSVNNNLADWQNVKNKLANSDGITAAGAYVQGNGLLSTGGQANPVEIFGINPDEQTNLSELPHKMVVGELSNLKENQFGMVIGQKLAENLGVNIGDKITLVVPSATFTPVGVLPRFKAFKVVGIFHVGNGFGYDSSLAYIDLKDAQKLFLLGSGVTGIQLKLKDFYAAPSIAKNLQTDMAQEGYVVSDWTQDYGAFFQAVKLEKTMMFLMLILIIAVAAFNLVSTLVMVVTDKKSDIAILRTLGATPRTILSIFMVQGMVVGVIGTVLGLILGVILALHVTGLVDFIQQTFHVQLIASDVYYVNYLPSKLLWSDVIKICGVAFLLCLLATLYPAWRAAKTQPAEALRYE